MCPPGVDQTERSPQTWHILTPKTRKYIRGVECLDRLYLFELLHCPSPLPLSGRDAASPIVPSKSNTTPSSLERLPSELLSLIFTNEELEHRDMAALGLSSTHLWLHFLSACQGKSNMGALSRTPFFCIGNYLTHFPKRACELFPELKDEKRPRQRPGLPIRYWTAAARRWLQGMTYDSESLLEEGVLNNWVSVLGSVKDHGIGPATMQQLERSLCLATQEHGPGEVGEKWFLRNLHTKEYVRLEATLEQNPESKDGKERGFDDDALQADVAAQDQEAAPRPTVATVESAPWLSLDVGLVFMTMYFRKLYDDGTDFFKGQWNGHEFDILSAEQWKSFEHGEWADATERFKEVSKDVRFYPFKGKHPSIGRP